MNGERMQAKARLIAACIAVAGGIAAAGPAHALSCQMLEAELTRLESQASRPDPRALRYERAWREQAAVLDRAERRAEYAGCLGGSFSFFRSQPSPRCGAVMANINEMRANLDKLEHMRARYSGGTSERRADRVRELIGRQGCRAGEWRSARTRSWGPPDAEGYGPDFSARQTYAARGVYRTLCVRTCDGYYFPISFSTTPDHFAADEETCQARCPGTEASLYVQPDPTGDTADMVSLTGEPYSALPSAFQYRQSVDKACTCQASGDENFSVIATAPPQPFLPGEEITPGEETLSLQDGGTIRVWGEANIDDMTLAAPPGPAERPAVPQARPEPPESASLQLRGSDPQTAPAAKGPGSAPASAPQQASAPAESEQAAPPAGETGASEKPVGEKTEAGAPDPGKIRIVGPSYWGGPQKEEVLVAPVRR